MRIEKLKEILDLHKEYINTNFPKGRKEENLIKQLSYDGMYENIQTQGKEKIPKLLEKYIEGILNFMKNRKERAIKCQTEIVNLIEAEFSENFNEKEKNWLVYQITKFDEARQVRPGLEGLLNAIRDFQD